MTLNQFDLRLKDGVTEGKWRSGGQIEVHSQIWVDGVHLDEPHFIDLPLVITVSMCKVGMKSSHAVAVLEVAPELCRASM